MEILKEREFLLNGLPYKLQYCESDVIFKECICEECCFSKKPECALMGRMDKDFNVTNIHQVDNPCSTISEGFKKDHFNRYRIIPKRCVEKLSEEDQKLVDFMLGDL